MRKAIICLLLFLFVAFVGKAQTGTITTVVGCGFVIDTGDGGPATTASICASYPSPHDRNGNFYIGSRCDNVRKITPSGIITHFGGTGVSGYSGDGGAATAAKIHYPLSWVIDDSDNLYVADALNCRIRRINITTGIISTYAGNGANIDTGDGNTATNAAITNPQGIEFDANYNLYIASSGTVRKVDRATHIIHTIAGTGTFGYSGDGAPATAAQVYVQGLCADRYGNVYTAEWGNSRIRKIDAATGIITTIAGNGTYTYNGEGVLATAAQVSPFDVKIDADGNIIFADDNNQRIRYIDLTGHVYTLAGIGTAGFSGDGGSATNAKMYNPEGLALDDCKNIYFDDNQNHRIRKITAIIPAVTAINILSLPGNHVCYGMPVTFTATTMYAGSSPVYQWKVNGTNVGASTPAYTYTPANGDSVQCQLTSSLACLTTSPVAMSNAVYMHVDTLAPPVVTIGGDTVRNAGATVNLTATITGGSGSYILHWRNHGVEFTTTTTPSASYTKPAGTDTITVLYVSTGRGCYDSMVSGPHEVYDHNVSVGSLQSAVSSLRVYPNPATKDLTIEGGKGCEVSVVNVVGCKLLSEYLISDKEVMDISTLVQGVYFVEVVDISSGERVVRLLQVLR